MHHPLDEIYGPLVCKQCADERIAVLEARVEDLQAQIAVKDHAIKGLYKLSIQDERELAEERARLMLMRKLLWLRHGHPVSALYGDDGEMQCAACCLDFKRQEPAEIEAAFERQGRAAADAARRTE